MNYPDLQSCLRDLEKSGQLIRVKEVVDPHLEMAAIHLRVHEKGGPALLFENLKDCRYSAVSNIFGTLDRSRHIFRDHLEDVKKLMYLRDHPESILKNPALALRLGFFARKALPKRIRSASHRFFEEIKISDLPQIVHWPGDGGAFITLPQVYSEDLDAPGVLHSNLGMYRIQLSGNDYLQNKEIGLHYQLHRGIGIHQTKSEKKGIPLQVSVFIGGPPAHSLAAVMPLPEGMSELGFAGLMGGRRFRYFYEDGNLLSAEADFVITGEVLCGHTKLEGPFGDHLGYYSLQHPFPVMRVKKVFANRKNPIWPFTVVGRPPQEDTQFGALIHDIAGKTLSKEIPGLLALNAVDAAGVHPLLLALGSERYTPYLAEKRPSELITLSNRIFGTGQLSLAKYLFIAAGSDSLPDVNDLQGFFIYCLERVDFSRDLHFQTKTSIDTLDYSGTEVNSGSKVAVTIYGDLCRTLSGELPSGISNFKSKMIMPGIMALSGIDFNSYRQAHSDILQIKKALELVDLKGIGLIVICDDSDFTAKNLSNFVWVTFTRSNPSHDIYGMGEEVTNKHWGCKGPLMIDARTKPHHAPPLVKDPLTEEKIDHIFRLGGSLNGVV